LLVLQNKRDKDESE